MAKSAALNITPTEKPRPPAGQVFLYRVNDQWHYRTPDGEEYPLPTPWRYAALLRAEAIVRDLADREEPSFSAAVYAPGCPLCGEDDNQHDARCAYERARSYVETEGAS